MFHRTEDWHDDMFFSVCHSRLGRRGVLADVAGPPQKEVEVYIFIYIYIYIYAQAMLW